MGDAEIRLVDDAVSVKQQIEIERAWSVGDAANPPMATLDVKQPLEQLPGGKVGGEFGDGVEERGLSGRAADRVGFVEGRAGDDLNVAGFGEVGEGLADVLGAIPEVGAEPDEHTCYH